MENLCIYKDLLSLPKAFGMLAKLKFIYKGCPVSNHRNFDNGLVCIFSKNSLFSKYPLFCICCKIMFIYKGFQPIFIKVKVNFKAKATYFKK